MEGQTGLRSNSCFTERLIIFLASQTVTVRKGRGKWRLTSGEGAENWCTVYHCPIGPLFTQLHNVASAENLRVEKNKAGYTATDVACGWAGAILEVTGTFGQEQ